MRDVSIIGIGQTPVGEHWEISLRHLALEAVREAAADAHIDHADALFVGNMSAGQIGGQTNLGALIADFVGLRGIEAVTVEASSASGGAAVRQAYLAVASGALDFALVVGVEKLTDVLGSQAVSAQMTAVDRDYEASHGVTPLSAAAMLMRRYMYEYDAVPIDFASFSVNAHRNAVNNPNAMFHNKITPESFVKAPMIAEPINLFDAAPAADGAAAIVLAPTDWAKANRRDGVIRVAASAVATDALAIHDRHDPLWLRAAELSVRKAYQQADVTPRDVNLFELHDSCTILAAMSLEAAGFAGRGLGVTFAARGGIERGGVLPISTQGGLKGRGDPGGATGLYQLVEVVQQLRGQAGDNQVEDARIGMAQNLGATGATAVTHILIRDE
jgi:acetyl-CoA C-acetyltransferase